MKLAMTLLALPPFPSKLSLPPIHESVCNPGLDPTPSIWTLHTLPLTFDLPCPKARPIPRPSLHAPQSLAALLLLLHLKLVGPTLNPDPTPLLWCHLGSVTLPLQLQDRLVLGCKGDVWFIWVWMWCRRCRKWERERKKNVCVKSWCRRRIHSPTAALPGWHRACQPTNCRMQKAMQVWHASVPGVCTVPALEKCRKKLTDIYIYDIYKYKYI